MASIVRWLVGIPLAALVTFALFVLMIILIAGEFVAQEKSEAASFEINPEVEEVEILEREVSIQTLQQVVTPPPPPMIAREEADQPTERMASLEGAIPEFEPIEIDRQSFEITISDRDAQPLIRIPPQMPPRADKSGHCNLQFDVSPEGKPFNVVATSCSSNVFKSASIKAVQRWNYQPKIQDGRPVSRSGVRDRIRFVLQDERGNTIPE